MIKNKVKKELGEEVFSEALSIFLIQSKRDMMLLNLYCESKDYTNAKIISHKLIGTFEAIGVKRMPTLIRKLDEDLKDRYFKKVVLAELNQQFLELKTFIKEEYALEIEA